MTPVLDLRTMALMYVGIRFGLALGLAYLWWAQRNDPPAKYWAIGALLSAVGLGLMGLRNLVPWWVSELLGNAWMLPGWMIFDYGILKAAGRKPAWAWGLALCALSILGLAWFRFVQPLPYVGMAVHHVVLVAFDACAVVACLTVPRSLRTPTFRLIALVLLAFIGTCVGRMANDVFNLGWVVGGWTARMILVAISMIQFPVMVMLLALLTSQRRQEELNEQANRDSLTGALNRRAFDELVLREWSRSVRHRYPLSLLTVDIDHFKTFNDQHGHSIGDATLVEASKAALGALRRGDSWCRHGGEEFVVLLPDTTLDQALVVAERLRAAVEQVKVPSPSGLLGVTVSIGAAERLPFHGHWMEVLSDSDAALYQAKATGRNRVMAGTGA